MAENAPIEKVVVEVKGKKIVLDPANMHYNENSLGDYMNKEYGWVDYLGKQLEYAQKEVLHAEIEAEAIYSIKFMESKDNGNSDNYAKAYSLANLDVSNAKKKVIDCKEIVGHLKAHLNAWYKNHDNVKSRSFSLNQEIKILNRDFYETNTNSPEPSTCEAEDFLR